MNTAVNDLLAEVCQLLASIQLAGQTDRQTDIRLASDRQMGRWKATERHKVAQSRGDNVVTCTLRLRLCEMYKQAPWTWTYTYILLQELWKAHLKEQLSEIEQVLGQGQEPLQQLLEALSPLVFQHCMPGAHCDLVLILT